MVHRSSTYTTGAKAQLGWGRDAALKGRSSTALLAFCTLEYERVATPTSGEGH
jgi:hypothetical protein